MRAPGSSGEPVIIVSGLPRSGTSLMMSMLSAGGVAIITDDLRAADLDNPSGYFEFEPVKRLGAGDTAWLRDAGGKAVKVVSALVEHLPSELAYRVIFMRRRLTEVLASQARMLEHRGESLGEAGDARLAELFRKHTERVLRSLADRPEVLLLEIDYNDLLKDPLPQAEAVNQFLGGRLDVDRMVAVVNPELYRNRA